ncbi:uncharacterized protein [Anabrus simplex]|uniref:uncharacterized protein n=1 Tax=Anabrus simplex TaxID=316456 RepID=UPI0035A2C93A
MSPSNLSIKPTQLGQNMSSGYVVHLTANDFSDSVQDSEPKCSYSSSEHQNIAIKQEKVSENENDEPFSGDSCSNSSSMSSNNNMDPVLKESHRSFENISVKQEKVNGEEDEPHVDLLSEPVEVKHEAADINPSMFVSVKMNENDTKMEPLFQDKKFFCCDMCGRVFSARPHLVIHIRSVHNHEKPFVCPTCGTAFAHRSTLTVHVRGHTGEKPFSCDHCDRKFTKKGNLNLHLQVHSGIKPFVCSLCEKAFARPNNLIEHMRVHTGERAYVCTVCEKSFSSQSVLNRHKRLHKTKETIKCERCNKSFSRISYLSEHQRIHTGEKPYHCQLCGESFMHRGQVYRHKQIHKLQTDVVPVLLRPDVNPPVIVGIPVEDTLTKIGFKNPTNSVDAIQNRPSENSSCCKNPKMRLSPLRTEITSVLETSNSFLPDSMAFSNALKSTQCKNKELSCNSCLHIENKIVDHQGAGGAQSKNVGVTSTGKLCNTTDFDLSDKTFSEELLAHKPTPPSIPSGINNKGDIESLSFYGTSHNSSDSNMSDEMHLKHSLDYEVTVNSPDSKVPADAGVEDRSISKANERESDSSDRGLGNLENSSFSNIAVLKNECKSSCNVSDNEENSSDYERTNDSSGLGDENSCLSERSKEKMDNFLSAVQLVRGVRYTPSKASTELSVKPSLRMKLEMSKDSSSEYVISGDNFGTTSVNVPFSQSHGVIGGLHVQNKVELPDVENNTTVDLCVRTSNHSTFIKDHSLNNISVSDAPNSSFYMRIRNPEISEFHISSDSSCSTSFYLREKCLNSSFNTDVRNTSTLPSIPVNNPMNSSYEVSSRKCSVFDVPAASLVSFGFANTVKLAEQSPCGFAVSHLDKNHTS